MASENVNSGLAVQALPDASLDSYGEPSGNVQALPDAGLDSYGEPSGKKNQNAKKKLRQTTEKYKIKKRVRQTTQKYRFARQCRDASPKLRAVRQARRKTEASKAKKRLLEAGPKAKISRQQRKRARFWEPCFFNWNLVRNLQRNVKETSKGAPFAPRFHSDGRISIVQHGVTMYLPCPDEPSVPSPASEPAPTEDKNGETDEEDKCKTDVINAIPTRETQERLVWKVLRQDGFTTWALDPTGGLSGNVLEAIRTSMPDAVWCWRWPRQAVVCMAIAQKRVFDRRREAMGEVSGDCGFALQVGSECKESLTVTPDGGLLGLAQELEQQARQQVGERLAEQIRGFGLALSLRCRIGSINQARGLTEPGSTRARHELRENLVCSSHLCCAKWSRRKVRDWKQRQTRLAVSWRANRARYDNCLKTRDELENSTCPGDKDRLHFGIFKDSGISGTNAWEFTSAGRPPWFTDAGVEPKPPRTGCTHTRRLKRFEWHCPLSKHSLEEILGASGNFTEKIDNRWQPVKLSDDFCNPPQELRKFLCNNLCPLWCCTLDCPWNSNSLSPDPSFATYLPSNVTGLPPAFNEPLALHACRCDSKVCYRCLIQRCSQEASDICLEDPPPPGYVPFAGAVEPLLDSSVPAFTPSIYALSCRYWKRTQFQLGPYVPIFDPLPNSHWRDCVKRLGWRPDEFEYNNLACRKHYSQPMHVWSLKEGKEWSDNAASEMDYARDSGYEWRWERLESSHNLSWLRYPLVDAVLVDASTECITSLQKTHHKWITNLPAIQLNEPLSLRCVFCTLLHGPPHGHPHTCARDGRKPPEDIALRMAQAVACFYGQCYGKAVRIDADMVIACAHKWDQVKRVLDKHGQQRTDNQTALLYALLAELDAESCRLNSYTTCVLRPGAKRAAELAFLGQLREVERDLAKRIEAAMEPERRQEEAEQKLGITRVASLSTLSCSFTQVRLPLCGASSFKALVQFLFLLLLCGLPSAHSRALRPCS